jgi:uncharacterized repeat protein (TIGR02543 family)
MKRKSNVRNLTKFKRSVKAISPVIAILLMIAIAVVASLVAYAWIIGFIGRTTTNTGHEILIQSASHAQGTYQYLIVYVQNTGQGAVHLKQDGSVYVNDVLHMITHSPQGTSVASGALIPVAVGQTVEVVTDYLTSPGDHLKIKIVTFEGTIMEIIDNGYGTQTVSGGGNTPPPGGGTPPPTGRYTLTVGVVGQGLVSKNPVQPGNSYAAGQQVQLIPAAQTGWQFDHWTGAISGSASPGSLTMTSDKSVIATFTQKEYSLNIQIQGTGTVTKSPDQLTYHVGDHVGLTATQGGGWTFVGFSGDITGTSPTATVTIDQNPEVTATFTQATTQYSLTVTANPSNGGTVDLSNPGPTYTNGEIVTLTPHAAAGYTFIGWAGDVTGNAQPGQVTISRNMIVTANFSPTTISLTLSTNPPYAGSIIANPAGPYNYGDVVQLTAVPNTPFNFATWGQDLSGSTNPVSITLNGNKAVTANFAPIEYPLDLQVIGQGTVTKSPDKATYHFGDLVQLTETPTAGWLFAGFTGDATSSGAQVTVAIDENPTVTASFTQEEYSLTVTSNPSAGGPVARSNPGPYHLNDQVTLTPQAVFGYHFTEWTGDLTGTTTPATITITGNMIVTANFDPNPVTLTLNTNPPNTGIINTVPAGPYRFGDTVELTAVPIAGYQFASWSGGLAGTTNPSPITLYGDTTITANFVQIEYSLAITVSPSQGGTVTKLPNQATYHLNDHVTLTATANAGYTFAGFSGDITGASPATITIDRNAQVTATFTQLQYTLTTTANPLAGGSIQRSSQGPYHLNDAVTLTAVPATGYAFTGWDGALSGSTNPAPLTITGNMVVTANFAPIVVTLTTNISPAGTGAITPNNPGPYHYGDTVQLTAVPNNGYSFGQWSQDATGTTNPVTITLNGNKQVTATFTQNPTQVLLTSGFDGSGLQWQVGWDDWGNNGPWNVQTNQYYSPSQSVGATSSIDGPFSCDPLNSLGGTAIHVTFKFRVANTEPTDLQLRYSVNASTNYNDHRWISIASGTVDGVAHSGNIGDATANTWHTYACTIVPTSGPSGSGPFTSSFRFQFYATLASGESVWVDDVAITMDIT